MAEKFKEVANEWRKEVDNKGLKKSTKATYMYTLNHILMPSVGDVDMETISDHEYLIKLKDVFLEQYAESTVNNIFSIINLVLRYYKNMPERISFPAKACRDDTAAIQKEKIFEILNDEEDTSYVKLGIAIAVYTGVSISELCGITWSDVYIENGVIYIRRIVSRTDELTVEKCEGRIVPIAKPLLKILAAYSKKCYNPDAYVLTSKITPREPRTLQYATKAYGGNITYSLIRRMFIINAIRNGMPLHIISEVTGLTLSHLAKRFEGYIPKSTLTEKKGAMRKYIVY